jgi:chromosome condensin MukBEF complex kleisin-like MukF subunit
MQNGEHHIGVFKRKNSPKKKIAINLNNQQKRIINNCKSLLSETFLVLSENEYDDKA